MENRFFLQGKLNLSGSFHAKRSGYHVASAIGVVSEINFLLECCGLEYAYNLSDIDAEIRQL